MSSVRGLPSALLSDPPSSTAVDTPNWVLHTAQNDLPAQFNALPDAIRQVRDVAVHLSGVVEQHAEVLNELQIVNATASAERVLETERNLTAIKNERSKLSTVVEDLSGKHSTMVEDLSGKHNALRNQFEALGRRFDGLRGDMQHVRRSLSSSHYNSNHVGIDAEGLKLIYLKLMHSCIMKQCDAVAQSIKFDSVWQNVYRMEENDDLSWPDIVRMALDATQADSENALYWQCKILNLLNFKDLKGAAGRANLLAQEFAAQPGQESKDMKAHMVSGRWHTVLKASVQSAQEALVLFSQSTVPSTTPSVLPLHTKNSPAKPPPKPPSGPKGQVAGTKRGHAEADLGKDWEELVRERAKMARDMEALDREIERLRAGPKQSHALPERLQTHPERRSMVHTDCYPPRAVDSYKPQEAPAVGKKRTGANLVPVSNGKRPQAAGLPSTYTGEASGTALAHSSSASRPGPGPRLVETHAKGLFSFDN